MNLIFERVHKNDEKKVGKVYEIIKSSGEHMYETQGLTHWKNPYSIESIKHDCNTKKVFLIKDLKSNDYVHTFQLEFKDSNGGDKFAYINKFATLPDASGKGIGKESLAYIEDYCLEHKVSKILLDVYDKSEHAIYFYKKRGFHITSSKPTKNFSVYIMEKELQ